MPKENQSKGGRPPDPQSADGYLIEILKDIQKLNRLSRQKGELMVKKIDGHLKTLESQGALGLRDMLDVLETYSKLPSATGSMIAPLSKILNDLKSPKGSGSHDESNVNTWKEELLGPEE